MIRNCTTSDRNRLVEIINGIRLFTQEEKKVAIEIIDESIHNKYQEDYSIYVIEHNSFVVGYYCYGPRALTNGVYDLYWIAIDEEFQNKGIGKILLTHCEGQIASVNGRLILVETSSLDEYIGTRSFYENNSYSIVSKIKDFYNCGNDLIIYAKYL
ncbi:MAG: GNAT family N-acetyltransferase [Melioribacteraceae bacterium]|nr:GNAT family N-acetyltransferase [Melioribacteraceae bacterium]